MLTWKATRSKKTTSCDRRSGSQTYKIQVDDIEAIKILKGRYFRFMDTKDWTAWGGLFTADATLDADTAVSTRGADPKSMPTVRGRNEIVSFVRSFVDECITVHHGHTPEIEIITPTSAKGIWAMEDIVDKVGARLLRRVRSLSRNVSQRGRWSVAHRDSASSANPPR